MRQQGLAESASECRGVQRLQHEALGVGGGKRCQLSTDLVHLAGREGEGPEQKGGGGDVRGRDNGVECDGGSWGGRRHWAEQ